MERRDDNRKIRKKVKEEDGRVDTKEKWKNRRKS